jgi:polyhydroxyalkanoate synthesis regulator phasin
VSGAASDGARAHMAEPDNSALDSLERLALAAVGALALTAERADQLVDELADRGGLRRDEARALVEDMRARWRGDALRFSERVATQMNSALREMGLVTRDEYEELELRVAQLEHRLSLLERKPRALPSA